MSTIEVGSKIDGRYEVISLLGQGGMSVVYKSFDHVEKRLVAVKLILQDGIADGRRLLRSKREELAASRLDHPCITKVYEYGLTDDQKPYLVMELVEGTTLAEIIARQGQLPLETTLSVFTLICDGLTHAHEHMILHRDLKPSNIMLNQDENQLLQVKILDFGIAKILDADRIQSPALTLTGELVGSPLYMSPEQARGKKLDNRSDLYSLGCTLYEALTGGPPHIAHSAMSTLLKRETDQPLSMGEASLGRDFPAQLESIVAKLLKHDANERYQSALQVKEDLVAMSKGSEHEILLEQRKTAAESRQLKALTFKNGLRKTFPLIMLTAVFLLGWTCLSNWLAKRQKANIVASAPALEDLFILPPIDIQTATEMSKGTYSTKNQEFLQSEANLLAEMRDYAQEHGDDTLEYANRLEKLSKINALAGKREHAAQCLELAINIYRKRLASNDPRLLEGLMRLANAEAILGGAGDANALDESIKQYDRAQLICDQNWPQKSMDIANNIHATAKNLIGQHQYVQAERLFDKALILFQSRLGAESLEVEDTLRLLARCYRGRGLDSQAFDCQKRAIAILKKNQSVTPREYVEAYMELAIDQENLSLNNDKTKRQDAIDSLNQALGICRAAPNQFALEIAELQRRVGDCEHQSAVESNVYDIAPYKRAEKLYSQSLTAYRRLKPSDYETLADLCGKLSSVLKAQNRKSEAIKYYEQSLKYNDAIVTEARKAGKPDADLLARVAMAKGALNREAGRFDEALAEHLRALDRRGEVYHLNSIQCADALMDVGLDYQLAGKLDKAFKSYKTAYEIYKSDLGASDYRTVRAEQNRNRVWEQAGGRKRKLKTVKAGHQKNGKPDIGDNQT